MEIKWKCSILHRMRSIGMQSILGLVLMEFILGSKFPSKSRCSVISSLRDAAHKKKRDFLGIFPKCRTPPPSPPFGNPCFQKKKFGLFCILGPQEHFWSSQKCSLFGQFYFSKVLGIGDPPKNSLFLLLGIRDPPKTSMFRHTKNETVNIKQFWELRRPPPPFGKNSQKIPFIFFGSVPQRHDDT